MKKIQAQGRSVYVPCTSEEIRIYHRELKPNLVYYDCGASSEKEAETTLQWLVDHT